MTATYGLIVMPTYNDWASCTRLIEALDKALSNSEEKRYRVLVVDDGSTEPATLPVQAPFEVIEEIDVLHLKRNLGHQRAICIALTYIERHFASEAIILMDSDGQDDPEDVPRLLAAFEKHNQQPIVFARRTKRSEYWLFRFFLQLYKVTHRLLTGKGIHVGNFSVIPFHHLKSLVTVPELWSHYAAAVMHTRLPHVLVPSARAKRLDGASHMNFTSLMIHGLSAISVYSEKIGIRLLIATGIVIAFVCAGALGVLVLTDFTEELTPYWTVFSAGLLLIILLQIVLFAMSFSFLILSGRKNAGFIPARDYHFFINTIDNVWKNSPLPSNM